MDFKKIDMDTYERKSHFEFFKRMNYPYVGFTVNVDITDMNIAIKRKKLPFFLSFLYVAVNSANLVPELRRRIFEDGIIEYSHCDASHTVALENGTYCFCKTDGTLPFEQFLEKGVLEQEKSKKIASIHDSKDFLSLIFASCIPWISYTSIVQPMLDENDSNPRITFGKKFDLNDKTYMPITVLAHHAIVDGIHIAQFYKNFDEISKKVLIYLNKK